MQANKNGFFYVLDRQTGKLISARPFTDMSWATGIDSNGRPIEAPGARDVKDATSLLPPQKAGTTGILLRLILLRVLFISAFSKTTRSMPSRANWKFNPNDQTTGLNRAYHGPASDQMRKMPPSGELLAWDPVAQKEAWHVDLPIPKSGGTLTTAGNLVFQGRGDGKFAPIAPPMGKALGIRRGSGNLRAANYLCDRRNAIHHRAIGLGWAHGAWQPGERPRQRGRGRLLTFVLGGTATIPPYQHHFPGAHADIQTRGFEGGNRQGRVLFATYCARCHGNDVVSGGETPDLRYSIGKHTRCSSRSCAAEFVANKACHRSPTILRPRKCT